MTYSKMVKPELNQVLIDGNSCVRKVILNRPEKLNCISSVMVHQLLKTLKAFEVDPSVQLVILKGNGKAFCVGGDVKELVQLSLQGGWSCCAVPYKKQMILEYLLATYRKPLVALIDGMLMGGGAGMTMNGRFRIVTENAVFAMPEALLGLFADVGASHFLSKLPGYFGEYLALSGARIDGSEMLACGLATHFVTSKNLLLLEDALSELSPMNILAIDDIVSKFNYAQPAKPDSILRRLDVINRCFSRKTVEEIRSSLKLEAAKCPEKWISKTLGFMKAACPTSLKITLRVIREGRRKQSLERCLSRDYTIFRHFARRTVGGDFYEGTRAMLMDKDRNPKWEPSGLELVTEEMLDQYFEEIHDDDNWDKLQFPNRSDFSSEVLHARL
ncbi:putative 3-hydroxyisobutyryl-CoA hydrolase 2 [Drosera capensis]